MCHSRLMGKYSALSFLFVFYPCYLHGCSGEVVQRTLHLCSLCGDLPQVAGNAWSLKTWSQNSDIRMMISCWPACMCETSGRT
jgi:hypothetical protein